VRFRLTLLAVLLTLGLAVGCTPTQAAQYLNDSGRGPVAADSQTARDASVFFTAFWQAVFRQVAAQNALVARWQGVANCESGGNWSINTGNGYYGGLQFSLSSWRAVGGPGYPHQQSAYTQSVYAERLKASQGLGAWPHCGRYYR
jgi:hypothetical protein